MVRSGRPKKICLLCPCAGFSQSWTFLTAGFALSDFEVEARGEKLQIPLYTGRKKEIKRIGAFISCGFDSSSDSLFRHYLGQLLCHTLSSPWSIDHRHHHHHQHHCHHHHQPSRYQAKISLLSVIYDWNWYVSLCPVLCISWWFSCRIGDRPPWITKMLLKFRQLKIFSAPLRRTICARNQM
jgi:hypothetical protein